MLFMRQNSPLVRGVVVCFLTLLFTSAYYAQEDKTSEGSLHLLNSDRQEVGLCPLKRTEVQAAVSGFVARVTVTQTFQNPRPNAIEAVYTFPLPNDAAVDNMTIRIGDRLIQSKVLEREKAKATYEQAKQEGKTAALLAQRRPDVFTQFVANIAPSAEVKVTISYVVTLPYLDDTYEFTFPMTIGRRYVPSGAGVDDAGQISPPSATRPGHTISMEINVDSGVPVSGVASATHEIETSMYSASRFTVRLGDGDVIPNRDFVLRYKTAGSKIEDAVLAHHDGRGGFFTLILQPPDKVMPADTTPKEVVFVLDTSGSMAGFPIAKAKEAMDLTLGHLNPYDTFNLITFAGETRILFDAPVPATPENLESARKMLADSTSSGGTEMMKAIRVALEPSDAQGHIRIACFMTDGGVTNDAEIIEEVRKHPNARVFAFGIGTSINHRLLDEITREGRGEVEYVRQADDGSAAARRFFERIRNPLLTDISLEYQGLSVSDPYPQKIPDLFDAKPVMITGRYTQAGRGKIVLRGQMQGQPFSREIDVELPAEKTENNVLATLWARKKIADLSRRDLLEKDEAITKAITSLGLEYRLLTSFTSMVAVDETPSTDRTPPERVEVPEADVAVPASPGTVYSAVNVTSAADAVSSATSTNVTTTTVYLELPLNGRSYQSVLSIAPGVTQLPGSRHVAQQGLLSLNGQRGTSNQFKVDGIDANRGISSPGFPVGVLPELTAAGGTNSMSTADATEELAITSFATAKVGRVAGGTINLTTKAGTNSNHGSLFEVFGNQALNAADPFAGARGFGRAPSRLNIFGGTFGGPIVNDRAFYFVNYEGMRLRQGAFSVSEVPGAGARLAAAPGLRAIFGAFPVANGSPTSDGFAEFSSVFANPAAHDIAGARIDINATDDLLFTTRYNFAKSRAAWRGDQGLSLNSQRFLDTSSSSIYLLARYVFSPNAIISGQAAFSRNTVGERYSIDDFGGAVVPAGFPDSDFLKSSLAGRTSLAAGGRARSVTNEFQSIVDSAVIAGNHDMAFGLDFRRIGFDIEPLVAERNVLFPGLAPSGIAAGINEISRSPVSRAIHSFSAYAQDKYRVSKNTNIEYGLRWDVDFAPSRELPVVALQNVSANINSGFRNFAPRIGIAIDPTGRSRAVIRFSAGLFYDFGNLDAAAAFLDSYPYATGLYARNASFDALPAIPLRPLTLFDSNLATPHTWQIMTGYEHEFISNYRIMATYTAAFGRDQLLSRTLTGADPVSNVIRLTDNSGSSRFQALTIAVDHRFSYNFSFNVRYTLSESTDNFSPSTITMGTFLADPAAEKGPSDFDARHVFSAFGQFDIPTPYKRGPGKWLLGDWGLSGNLNARSAFPVNVTYAQVNDLGVTLYRPDAVPGASAYDTTGEIRAIDPAAFSIPPTLRQGSLERNSLRGFPLLQLNLSLHKRFRLGSESSLQFKVEAFNVLNNVNYENMSGSLGTRFQDGTFSPNYYFGKTVSSLGSGGYSQLYLYGGARTVQLSAKFVF